MAIYTEWRADAAYAVRTLTRTASFTVVTLTMLAFGIGANVAMFSVWNDLLRAPLPGVAHPEQLVMFSDPEAAGMWIGRTDGPRSWLSYDEFVQLRDRSHSFTGLAATQSSVNTWRLHSEVAESITGRLVSGEFFEVLGVHAATGRVLGPADDRDGASAAVISYGYWQRHFGGRADVVGKTITISGTPVPIVGVAPAGFIGETIGEAPEVWLPLHMQPRVLGGRDRLHDAPPEKVMWLHVIGRRKPHVAIAQAEAEVNTIFRAGLRSFYGAAISGPRGRELLNQQLVLRSGRRGASSMRQEFSTSLTALLAAVGIVLLIGCANLANLMLARGIARRPEMAMRLTLGAGRSRLVRQLVAESLVLAIAGAAAALPVAYWLHAVLLGMMRRFGDISLNFTIDPPLLVFFAVITGLVVIVIGVVPAWHVTNPKVTSALLPQQHGGVGRPVRHKSDRLLVALQVALSLPLLIVAGLLVRSVYNLDHADLGFASDRLVLVRVDLHDAYTGERREQALLELVAAMRQMPSVRAVSFSQLGIFGGGESLREIDVEGYTPSNANDSSSAVDVIGPGYFSTLETAVVQGRELLERDRGRAANVAVINEAFARRFFPHTNPIGRHIRAVADRAPTPYEIVGIARDAHTQKIRGDVAPRYFVPVREPSSSVDSPTLVIRTSTDAATMVESARNAISRALPAVPIESANAIEAVIAPLLAQDHMTATIAATFGCLALTLALIGLYGVVAYRVAQRTGEIAVRIAVGADSRRVVEMILRESLGVVGVGIAVGLAFAYAATRLVERRLYGVTTEDPATAICAIVALLAAGMLAAYVPARRASLLDPMAALRRQ